MRRGEKTLRLLLRSVQQWLDDSDVTEVYINARTFGLRSSRCTTAQSGTVRCSAGMSGGGGNSNRSSCASTKSSGSVQVSPQSRAQPR